jgi:hypothetical protein
MNVTREKLEEIFKVYEDKKNNNPNTIKTSEMGMHSLIQQNSSGQLGCFHQRRISPNSKKE